MTMKPCARHSSGAHHVWIHQQPYQLFTSIPFHKMKTISKQTKPLLSDASQALSCRGARQVTLHAVVCQVNLPHGAGTLVKCRTLICLLPDHRCDLGNLSMQMPSMWAGVPYRPKHVPVYTCELGTLHIALKVDIYTFGHSAQHKAW
jgi:hypothetical protein